MKTRCLKWTQALISLAVLILLAASAKDKKQMQEEAAALLAHDRELSDISCEGCPPFRLEGTIRLPRDRKSTSASGSYLFDWKSPGQWREEVTFPSYQGVRVAREGKVWIRSDAPFAPWQVRQLQKALGSTRITKFGADELGIVEARERGGQKLNCVEVIQGTASGRKLCFNQTEGTLTYVKTWDGEYEYGNYAPWGDKSFPNVIRVYVNGEFVVELSVEKLTHESMLDEQAFLPPNDAATRITCEDPTTPRRVKGGEPEYTTKARNARVSGSLRAYMAIGADGKVYHVEIVRSLEPTLDATSVDTIRRWEFQPATCGGVPTETSVFVEVSFRIF